MLTKGASHIGSRSSDAPWWEVPDEICLLRQSSATPVEFRRPRGDSQLVALRSAPGGCYSPLDPPVPPRWLVVGRARPPPSGRRLREGLEPPAAFLALQPFPCLRPGRALLGPPPLLPLDEPPGDERGRNALGARALAQPARRDAGVVERAQHLLETLGRACQ